MPIIVTCNSCGKKYRLKDELAGKKFRCKGCEQILVVAASGGQPQKLQERRRRSPQKGSADGDKRGAQQRRSRLKQEDSYSDDLFGAALDRYGGNFGEDFSDDENPYRAPIHQAASAKRRKRAGGAAELTLSQKLFSFEGRINRTNY